jgi:quercetin dioxygenase-like cupin family protein
LANGDGSSAELKVQGEQTGGQWAVVEWRVRAGDEGPIHTHTREDETVYVLEGAITAFVGDQQIEVEAGSYGHCRRACHASSRCAVTRPRSW